jgi:microcystin-dependent protein
VDAFLGEIRLFPYNFEPNGWVRCVAGITLSPTTDSALFYLIGTKFGGDGQKTFALPDLSGQAPKGFEYYMSVKGDFPSP